MRLGHLITDYNALSRGSTVIKALHSTKHSYQVIQVFVPSGIKEGQVQKGTNIGE